jgi:hypothetical protein
MKYAQRAKDNIQEVPFWQEKKFAVKRFSGGIYIVGRLRARSASAKPSFSAGGHAATL